MPPTIIDAQGNVVRVDDPGVGPVRSCRAPNIREIHQPAEALPDEPRVDATVWVDTHRTTGPGRRRSLSRCPRLPRRRRNVEITRPMKTRVWLSLVLWVVALAAGWLSYQQSRSLRSMRMQISGTEQDAAPHGPGTLLPSGESMAIIPRAGTDFR